MNRTTLNQSHRCFNGDVTPQEKIFFPGNSGESFGVKESPICFHQTKTCLHSTKEQPQSALKIKQSSSTITNRKTQIQPYPQPVRPTLGRYETALHSESFKASCDVPPKKSSEQASVSRLMKKQNYMYQLPVSSSHHTYYFESLANALNIHLLQEACFDESSLSAPPWNAQSVALHMNHKFTNLYVAYQKATSDQKKMILKELQAYLPDAAITENFFCRTMQKLQNISEIKGIYYAVLSSETDIYTGLFSMLFGIPIRLCYMDSQSNPTTVDTRDFNLLQVGDHLHKLLSDSGVHQGGYSECRSRTIQDEDYYCILRLKDKDHCYVPNCNNWIQESSFTNMQLSLKRDACIQSTHYKDFHCIFEKMIRHS